MAIKLSEIGKRRADDWRNQPRPQALTEEMKKWVKENGCHLVDANTGHPRRTMAAGLQNAVLDLITEPINYLPPDGSEKTRAAAADFFNYFNIPAATGEGHEYLDYEKRTKNGIGVVLPTQQRALGAVKWMDKDNVAVLHNSTWGFNLVFAGCLNPGDTIGLPAGSYNAYFPVLSELGVYPEIIPTESENNFYPTFADILSFYNKYSSGDERFVEEKGLPNVKAMMLPSGNPTGRACTSAEAREVARAMNAITRRSKGRVVFILDDAYINMTHEEDPPIYYFLDDATRENCIFLYTGSKNYGATSWAGTVLSHDQPFMEYVRRSQQLGFLSAPPPGDAVMGAGMRLSVSEDIEARFRGIPPSEFGHRGRIVNSYQREIRYVEDGLAALQECYDLFPPLVDVSTPTNKALYLFPNFKALLKRPIPNVSLFGGKPVVPEPGDSEQLIPQTLHERLGFKTLEQDSDIIFLLEAMTYMEDYKLGISCRFGEGFKKENHVRFTCTHDEAHHREHELLLIGVKNMLDFLGIPKKKEFTYIEDTREAYNRKSLEPPKPKRDSAWIEKLYAFGSKWEEGRDKA